MRYEEHHSAEALAAYLKSNGFNVEYVPFEDDPPDFLFVVSAEHLPEQYWAVEVTGLTEYIDWGGKEVARRFPEMALEREIRRINEKHSDQFKYAYYVVAYLPINQGVMKSLEERVLGYIAGGQTEETALDRPEAEQLALADLGGNIDDASQEAIDLFKELARGHERIRIERLGEGKGICLGSVPGAGERLPGGATMVWDLQGNVEYSVDRMLKSKVCKMKRIESDVKRVLLVWSDLLFATCPMVADSISRLFSADGDGLDAIVFIEYGWTNVGVVANFTKLLG